MSLKQELLLDLLQLKVKYTEKEFNEVFSFLQNERVDHSFDEIVRLLNLIDINKKTTNQRTKKKLSNLEKVHNADQDHYLNLINFRDKLLNRSIAAETRELNRFSAEIGIPSSKGRKREQTIKLIIEFLAGLRPEEANHLIEEGLIFANETNSKFELLADAILQRSQTNEINKIE
ncbi:hypothetical protein [Paenibacillus polymyxa]|uniref:M1-384 n=1 Tax=Paenibacillus polymyxa (strain SC2) TaxID=886882 RepID=E3EC90_PAEPS|nr:hypothetical protein [Paenibacillus polymyxa]ADO54233.1 M1-384 [Paenibacillus polymyxa SC2]WPQ57154.1 hypothetical protein SKN87_01250 [Paenibacillus polymyxa]CCC83163.1 hypothetical protein PPM_0226 [Paenibacillus polymyxa M1]